MSVSKMTSNAPNPREKSPAEYLTPGDPPRYGLVRSRKGILTGFLALTLLLGMWVFVHYLGWLWFIFLTLLLGGGWVWVVAYADNLLAQGRYDQALQLVPFATMHRGGPNYFYLRGEILTNAGRYEEAERMLRESIDLAGSSKINIPIKALALVTLGSVLVDTGRFEDARCSIQRAADIYRNDSIWATGVAETLLCQGTFPKSALAHAERALKLFQSGKGRISGMGRIGEGPRFGTIMATKAWALAVCGDGVEARKAIDEALKSPARNTKGPLAQVHYKAGMSLRALSDHHGAKGHFALGAKIDPAGRWGRLCDDALRQASG